MKAYKSLILIMLTMNMAGCSTYPRTVSEALRMPPSWGPLESRNDGRCVDLDGTYSNQGNWTTGNNEIFKNALISQSILSVGLPGNDIGTKMRLQVAEDQQTLTFELFGDTQIKNKIPISCKSGSLVLEKTGGKVYLGDGVSRESLREEFTLLKATDGSLVVHAYSVGQYSTLLTKSHSNTVYGWYRFKQILQANKDN